jgi:general secretion pathway protein C
MTAMKFRTILTYFLFMLLVLPTISIVANARMVDGTESAKMRQNYKIKLVGTAIAEDPEYTVAVIESGSDGNQRSYHEGEQINGVLIVEILRARVIVETEQGEDFISLSRPLTLAQQLTIKAERPGTSQSPVPVVSRTSSSNNRRNRTLYLDGKALIAELGNIDDKIQDVSVDTVNIYGRPAGVKIHPIEPGSIFSKIGLKNGDVIKEVDGVKISNPEQAIAIIKKLKAGDNVDIKVKARRTRKIHLVVE